MGCHVCNIRQMQLEVEAESISTSNTNQIKTNCGIERFINQVAKKREGNRKTRRKNGAKKKKECGEWENRESMVEEG